MSNPNSLHMWGEKIGTRAGAVILGLALGILAIGPKASNKDASTRPEQMGPEPKVTLVGNALWAYESAMRKNGTIDYAAKRIKPDVTIISEDGEGGLTAVNGSGNPASLNIELPTEDSRNSQGAQGKISSVEFIDPESGEEITLTEDGLGGLDAADPQGNQVMKTFHIPLAGPEQK